MNYLTNTISPLMLQEGLTLTVSELRGMPAAFRMADYTSAISHEATAALLSQKTGEEIPFNRINLRLEAGDEILAICPTFRADCAREFTEEELANCGLRVFVASITEGGRQ